MPVCFEKDIRRQRQSPCCNKVISCISAWVADLTASQFWDSTILQFRHTVESTPRHSCKSISIRACSSSDLICCVPNNAAFQRSNFFKLTEISLFLRKFTLPCANNVFHWPHHFSFVEELAARSSNWMISELPAYQWLGLWIYLHSNTRSRFINAWDQSPYLVTDDLKHIGETTLPPLRYLGSVISTW